MADEPAMTFGQLLRSLRAQAGLTQEELAAASRLSARTISDLERGVALRPQPDRVRRLADALQLPFSARALFQTAAGGRAELDSARGGGARPRTLPRAIASFTGRTPDLQQLLETAASGSQSNVLVVEGMAGVGKTTL